MKITCYLQRVPWEHYPQEVLFQGLFQVHHQVPLSLSPYQEQRYLAHFVGAFDQK